MDYGAFVELLGVYPKTDGLCYIAQICDQRINHPSDVLRTGQRVKVKVSKPSSCHVLSLGHFL